MERYESLGLVGEGSYGTVLKCRHRDSGRLVAIKKFMDSDDDKTVKKIALREIKLLRQLRHDNLVNLLEVWKRRRRWYLVFEFVERTLLDDLEQNQSGLNLNTSRQYLYQILRAAAFCHQQNIIHRDIKPENILISQGGVVKMCDFGFARTMTSAAEGGVYTDYVATRWYRAPELLVGDTKYGKPVDVWAVGCLLLEMLTGQPLFPGDSDLDQIYHIVRCFGNLTAHHQEMFYRNPVFSGVRLPEYSGKVSLEQRFPTIAPTALDLAQSCLQMDPERRAQCSDLLEHPLFTHDSFHIRFLDELNAKIQKDHRENSTLPKITKTPRRQKNEGDDKSLKTKDKRQTEDVDEKINKEKERKEEEKMEKTKGKQPLKPSRMIRNTSEPLMFTKQSKTFGTKVIDNTAKTTAVLKGKHGKAAVVELRKEPEIPKSTKTLTSDSSEARETSNTVVAKLKHGKDGSQETKDNHLKNMDSNVGDSIGLNSSDNIVPSVTDKSLIEIQRSSISESGQDFGKSRNNSNIKVPKLSKSPAMGHPNRTLSPKASSTTGHIGIALRQKNGKSTTPEFPQDTSIAKITSSDQVESTFTFEASEMSSNDHIATPTIPSVTKPYQTTMTSEHQADQSIQGIEQRRTSECPKVLNPNPKPSKTTSNSVQKMAKNNTSLPTSPSKTLTSDLSRQSSKVFIETSPAHSVTKLPKGTSYSKFTKTASSSDTKPTNYTLCGPSKSSRGLLTDRELTETSIATTSQQDSCNTSNMDIRDHRCLKSLATKTTANHIDSSDASGCNIKKSELSEPPSVHQEITSKSRITKESRTNSTAISNETPKTILSVGTTALKTLNVVDKENRDEFALSLSIIASTKSLVTQTSKDSRSSNFEQKTNSNETELNIKTLKDPFLKSLIGQPKTKLGSFSNHTKSTTATTPKTVKTTNISFSSTTTPVPRASTRSFHNMDNADDEKFDFSVPDSTPPPPPPPSSTPLLLPPSSTPLIPSFSVVSPATSEQLSLGASFHPGTHTLRCVDKPRHHGGIYNRLSSHITGSLTAQVPEKNLSRECSFQSDLCSLGNSGGTKKKSDIHFPDLRGSVLPELRGREGKPNKGSLKDQRKGPPSEPYHHGQNSTDTQP